MFRFLYRKEIKNSEDQIIVHNHILETFKVPDNFGNTIINLGWIFTILSIIGSVIYLCNRSDVNQMRDYNNTINIENSKRQKQYELEVQKNIDSENIRREAEIVSNQMRYEHEENFAKINLPLEIKKLETFKIKCVDTK